MEEVFILVSLGFLTTNGVLLALWLAARARAHRAEDTLYAIASGRQQAPRTAAPSDTDMMATIDALRLEVERISDAQRFTTRLLTERAERGAPGTLKPITPH